jgi:hypothetical protein
MAKTIIKGTYHTTTTNTIYTAPSDKYAKVTIVYYGVENVSWTTPSNMVGLWINAIGASGFGKCGILQGNFPHVGVEVNTMFATDRGRLPIDGTFLMPPSTYLQADSAANTWSNFYFIIEEIASTTIEA